MSEPWPPTPWGMAELAASLREQSRQMKAAAARGGDPLDALTALQIEERTAMGPDDIITRFARIAPRAVRGRRWAPWLIRRRAMPQLQLVDGHAESWTIGYLLDVILTRDPWMHRIDITRATGARHVITPEHDGVLIDDLVAEWAGRHAHPFTLRLTGPGGGSWTSGAHGPSLELDAVDFCRAIAGRHPATGLLSTQVPF